MHRRHTIFTFFLYLLPTAFPIAIGSLLPTFAFTQDYLGIANSIFAGVNGIDVNPSSIVGNPVRWDVTLAGMNFSVANNYMGLHKDALRRAGGYPAFRDPDFTEDYLTQDSHGKPVSVFLAANLMLPSFMITRPKQMDAFAFTCRSRVYLNLDGIDPALAGIIMNGANDSSMFNRGLPAVRVSLQAMAWTEYGVSYGKTIRRTTDDQLDVGGRLKFLQGMYSLYLFAKDAQYKFYKEDSMLLVSSQVHYGHSSNLEFNRGAMKFAFGGKPSLGLDLGATYSFQSLVVPHSTERSASNTLREYRYRVGFSIQDLGWIKFLKPQNARDFTADLNTNFDFKSLQTSGTTPLSAADDTLMKKFAMVSNDNIYRMVLPTLLSVQGDYYAGKNVYVNSTVNYAFQFKNRESKIHEVTVFSITPRWDWKWLGAYLPFSYNKYARFRAGFTVRVGPLIIGTADLLPLLARRDIRSLDFHFLLKAPHIHIRKKAARRKDKSYMPRRDTAPQERRQPESGSPNSSAEGNGKRHFLPRLHLHLFKKKNQKSGKNEEKTIYRKM